jgi:hypothetical protein
LRLLRRTFVKFEGRKYSYRDMDRLATVFASEQLKLRNDGCCEQDRFFQSRGCHAAQVHPRLKF